MTLYLNENISADDIVRISTSKNLGGIKFYQKEEVTTNSSKNVSDHRNYFHIFKLMEKFNVPLQIHGEVNDKNIDE